MKKSLKYNSFDVSTHFLYMDDNSWECWGCGRCHANCGHHIFGRGKGTGPESSPLNYAPLNNHECHLARHGYLMTDEGKREMFQKTLDFLSSREYTLTDKDIQFLEKYENEIERLKIKI